jgi:Asp-tRNA(Asn)/Glu-tRNA(Gln) amidotransferase C subunit
MARDKLITIRIEGEKREAFNQLAKSQNTDTASLLYDFINQCLDGTIDIKLVTGKGNRLDNQLDDDRLNKIDNRIDGIETTTQRLAKRLDDWIEAFSDRLSDCDRELSEKMISLEHRLNALAMQLDSQQDRQQIGSIDTDSQKDSQQENPDIEPVATVETVYTVETAIESVEAVTDTVEAVTDTVESVDETDTSPLPNQETVETADTVEPDLTVEPVTGSIGLVRGDSIEPGKGEIPTTHKAIAARLGIKSQTKLNYWISTGRIPSEYADKCRFNESKTKIVWII